MDFVTRLVRTAMGLVCGCAVEEVVLRHRGSGAILSNGQQVPVRFNSARAATEFSGRFLDESRAWEAVAVAGSSLGRAA